MVVRAVRWRDVTLLALVTGCGFLLLSKAESCDSESDDAGHYAYSRDYVPERRNLTDARVAHVTGTVVLDGRAVSGVRIQAIVHPIGYHGTTVDDTTSKVDGTFALPITAGHLDSKQQVELIAWLPGMRGRASVMVAPGERVANVKLAIGRGLTVRGRVTDDKGDRVGRLDSREVAVCLGPDCVSASEDGTFELSSFELGQHRLAVIAGGVGHSVKELPLRKVAPRISVEQLSGVIAPITLQVDVAEAYRLFNRPSWDMSTSGGTARVRVVAARSAKLPRELMCMTPHGGEYTAVGDGLTPIVVPVLRVGQRTMLDCKADDFDWVWIENPASGRVIDVPMVRATVEDIDLGVELRSQSTGARVVDVADEAKASGLQPGDVVTAIDGISIANTTVAVVRLLGFRLPPGQSAELTIMRGDQQFPISVRSPQRRR
jgi:hypothetical protein